MSQQEPKQAVVSFLKRIKEDKKLNNMQEVKEFLLNNWFMYDSNFLRFVFYLYNNNEVE